MFYSRLKLALNLGMSVFLLNAWAEAAPPKGGGTSFNSSARPTLNNNIVKPKRSYRNPAIREALDLIKLGIPPTRAAKITGASKYSVFSALRRENKEDPNNMAQGSLYYNNASLQEKQTLIEHAANLVRNGMSINKAAGKAGVPSSSLHKYLQKKLYPINSTSLTTPGPSNPPGGPPQPATKEENNAFYDLFNIKPPSPSALTTPEPSTPPGGSPPPATQEENDAFYDLFNINPPSPSGGNED